MKRNMCGYDAVEDGLRAAGTEKFLCSLVREPLCNADKAVSEGSFFVSEGIKTACIISERDVGALEYLDEKREKLCAGFEIIILGKYLRNGFIKQMRAMSIPVMVAEDVRDIRKMTADALMYSELKRTPAAVYIPAAILRSRGPVESDGRYYCSNMYAAKPEELRERTEKLEKKYNPIYGVRCSGDDTDLTADYCRLTAGSHPQLIIAISGCAGIVMDIVKPQKGIFVCKMDMFGTKLHPERIRKYSRVIIIGYGSGYVKRLLEEKDALPEESVAIELSSDDLHRADEISRAIKKYVPDLNHESEQIQTAAGMPRELSTTLMCRDCGYRSEIQRITRSLRNTPVYEDIYCDKRGTIVRSGISCASSAYLGGVVITNRKDVHYGNLDVRYIEWDCGD